jgi:predicted phage terminase large subunit-like protein
MDGIPKASVYEWHFPPYGNTISFSHLEYEKNIYDWQSAQIPCIMFDELSQFTENQFWYLLSRNRSVCGVKPYVRCTYNPDGSSWVNKMVAWYLDDNGEYADESKCGIVRWFIKYNDKLTWGATKKECIENAIKEGLHESDCLPKSFTFISAKLEDNKILMDLDPSYKANLMAQSLVERERLLKGNHKIKVQSGTIFRKEWFPVDEVTPQTGILVRYWDFAATEQKDKNDPDYTAGVLVRYADNKIFYVEDIVHGRFTPHKLLEVLKNTAAQDGQEVWQWLEMDPGQAGISQVSYMAIELVGYNFRATAVPKKSKVERANPISAQAEVGNIHLKRGAWNTDFLDECTNFPDGKHDDMVDGFTGAVNKIIEKITNKFEIILQDRTNK